MWTPRTPRYYGNDQPCADESPGLMSWVAALLGALVPKTPDYHRAPWTDDPVATDDAATAALATSAPMPPPSGDGIRQAVAREQDPLARLLHALFGRAG